MNTTNSYDTKNVFDNLLCLLLASAETLESYVFAAIGESRKSETDAVIGDLLDAGLVESTVDVATHGAALRLTDSGKTMAEACATRFAMMRRSVLA